MIKVIIPLGANARGITNQQANLYEYIRLFNYISQSIVDQSPYYLYENKPMESIHGHNVLNLIKEQKVVLNKETLLTAISAEFGEEARYHTCSARELTAEELAKLPLMVGSTNVQ
ncbi:YecH family protein [Endozoicomonas sp. SCSIO W0465]|uniref:YecH family protein n=1 Tax=Endozoicomonas sp. SCSIO W0465 TaxID=2918516 RepID=UPI0020765B8E|nr:YecH family protein [Endozoicomonas sp. SCSIO W0465]USE39180.1 YecH family protein [Endozoicomonas sp. SCSIO W0465]